MFRRLNLHLQGDLITK